MLKRCSSDSGGLTGVGQEGMPSMINGDQIFATLSATSKPFLLDHGQNISGQEDASPTKVEEDNDTFDLAEEEEIWNSADLNPQAKRLIVSLLHSKSRLMKANAGLQMSLNAYEDSKFNLEKENSLLKNHLKSMQQLIQGSEKSREKIEEIEASLAESEKANHALKTINNQLENDITNLNGQIDTITQEMSDMSLQKEMDKDKLSTLTHHLNSLEHQLEESRHFLDDKDGIIYNKDLLINQQKSSMVELTTIGQDLREKIKDLEEQLELAVIRAGGSFLQEDGSFSGVKGNGLSLADELMLVSGVQQAESDDDSVEVDNILPGSNASENPLSFADELRLMNEFQQVESDDDSVEVDNVLPRSNENTLSLADELRLEFQQAKSDDDGVEIDDIHVSSKATTIKPEDAMEVTGTEEVKVIMKGEDMELLESNEHQTITQHVTSAVDETIKSEEDKVDQPVEFTVRPAKTELEVGRLEELVIMDEEVNDLRHQEVEEAFSTEDANDSISVKEALNHEGQRVDLSQDIKVEVMAQPEVEAVVEQAQLRTQGVDIALDQNSTSWRNQGIFLTTRMESFIIKTC